MLAPMLMFPLQNRLVVLTMDGGQEWRVTTMRRLREPCSDLGGVGTKLVAIILETWYIASLNTSVDANA